ncbi:MAG: hypothetical protein ACRD4S_01910 [Candidatus Acidiferrales bacterium]
MMKNAIQNGFLVVIVLCLAACSAVSATSLMQLSIAEMTKASPVIVRAKCIANATAWDGGEIWTFTSFAVEEAWKGSPPEQISVRLLGGRIGELTSTVSEVPRFRAGEDVVLFLEPASGGDYSVVSWMQGTFRIRRDPRTGEERIMQDTAVLATFNPATRQFETGGERNVPLDDFRLRVNAMIRRGSGRQP